MMHGVNMSRDAGIEFAVIMQNHTIYDVLEALLSNGWSMENNGHISILPLGDRGEHSWVDLELSEQNNVLDIIKEKEKRGEAIGVTLTWKDSNVGVDFLVFTKDTILFSLTINRKLLASSGFSDVSWYLEKIIPAITSCGVTIINTRWKELI
jgi:hypothetical protein